MARRPPGLRMCASLLAVIGAALPSSAAQAADDSRGRPWARGTAMVGPGFGLGLGSVTRLSFGVEGKYFVLNGLALGLSLSDDVLIFSSSLKQQYPGLNEKVPTNIFRMVPTLQYVFFRSRWFSPYVEAGVGPEFFNNKRGTFGHWVAGPGAYIGLGGRVFLNLGVDFFGSFPIGRCNDAFSATVRDATTMEDVVVQFDNRCAFGWSPKIGIVVALGKSRPRSRPRTAPPNPLPDEPEPPPPVETIEPPPPNEGPSEPPPPAEPAADPEVPPPTETPVEAPPVEPTEPPPPSDAPTPPVAVPP